MLSRREFLKVSAIAGVGLFVRRSQLYALPVDQHNINEGGNMTYRLLGRTGLNVSVLALSCEGFSGMSAQEITQELDYAQEQGVNFFDVYSPDPVFRDNLGKALKGRRKKFIVQGHIGAIWQDGMYQRTHDVDKSMAAFKDLLQSLGTDYVDIGMIHYVNDANDFRRIFEGPFFRMMNQYLKEGKIHYIGLSTQSTEVANMAVESGLVDVLMFSLNPAIDMVQDHNDKTKKILDPERIALYNLCERTDVGISVTHPFSGGNLLNNNDSPLGKALTVSQCIEYALTRPGVESVICGSNGPEYLRASMAWCTAKTAEKDFSTAMATIPGCKWDNYCMYCNHCAPCKKGIDIAAVNKCLNLVPQDGTVPKRIANQYNLLLHHAGECVECKDCKARCPFGVDVIGKMRLASKTFGK